METMIVVNDNAWLWGDDCSITAKLLLCRVWFQWICLWTRRVVNKRIANFSFRRWRINYNWTRCSHEFPLRFYFLDLLYSEQFWWLFFNGKIGWNRILLKFAKRENAGSIYYTQIRIRATEKIVRFPRLRLVFTPSSMVVETENRGCSDV